jgi:Cytochrome c554 and c-prime
MAASRVNVGGSFDAGKNELATLDPTLHFRMDSKGEELHETAVFGDARHAIEHSERIDIVVGSGRGGQTYAYWKGDRLFELPVSYWAGAGWVNSPGYLDGTADFDRPITARCLECHASHATPIAETGISNRFEKASLELGISCERCHGPGRAHVALHRAHAAGDEGSAAADILDIGKLMRDRQIEECGQCHGGLGKDLKPAFSYEPGAKMDEFIHLDPPDPRINLDVHGNQVAMLERSRCYAESGTMTCTTCHNPHEPEKAAASYSTKCTECHEAKQCGEFAELGEKIVENCVDCHMPMQTSKLIVSGENGKELRPQIRSHWIKVYGATAGVSAGSGGR